MLLGSSLEGQIITANAGVTSPEIPTLRESLDFREAKDYRSLTLNSRFLYGITPQLEIDLGFPTVLHRKVLPHDQEVRPGDFPSHRWRNPGRHPPPSPASCALP